MANDIMGQDEAQQFAEATFLDVIRGDLGDFRITIVREGGRYTIQFRVDESEPPTHSKGESFAEAWLAKGEARPTLSVIKGGRDNG